MLALQPMSCPMKTVPLLVLGSVLTLLGAAAGQSSAATTPQRLGEIKSWTAATYGSGADKACYAFTNEDLPVGSKATPAMLTVTERTKFRDEISLSQGITYTKGAKVVLTVGTQKFDFFTKDNMAYAINGANVIKALLRGIVVKATATAPNAQPVSNQFSLEGFRDAYKMILKACPATNR